MASARAYVIGVSLLSKPGEPPQPPPGTIPPQESLYAHVQYRFIDTGIVSSIPFDDWQYAPNVGQLLEISAEVIPTLNRVRIDGSDPPEFGPLLHNPPPPPNSVEAVREYHDLRRQLSQEVVEAGPMNSMSRRAT